MIFLPQIPALVVQPAPANQNIILEMANDIRRKSVKAMMAYLQCRLIERVGVANLDTSYRADKRLVLDRLR